MRTEVLFEERGSWAWWVHLLIWFCCAVCFFSVQGSVSGALRGEADAMPLGTAILIICLGLAFPLLFYSLMGQLRTRVTEEGVLVVWGMAEVIKKRVPFEEIEGVEAVTYSPLGEFGGWGIRMGSKKKRAWTVSGNQAVRLDLREGIKLYVGSQHPARLGERIRSGWSTFKGRSAS
ncbi:hypothetical protein ACFL3Z_01805 [Gemmatimonadota bacterium]